MMTIKMVNMGNERQFKVDVVYRHESLEKRLNELRDAGFAIAHLLVNTVNEYTIVYIKSHHAPK